MFNKEKKTKNKDIFLCHFPQFSVDSDGLKSVLGYLPFFYSESDKNFRMVAKLKVKNNLREMEQKDVLLRDEAVDKLLEEMSFSDDSCLHVFIIDILFDCSDPGVDEKLKGFPIKYPGVLAPHVASYLSKLFKHVISPRNMEYDIFEQRESVKNHV